MILLFLSFFLFLQYFTFKYNISCSWRLAALSAIVIFPVNYFSASGTALHMGVVINEMPHLQPKAVWSILLSHSATHIHQTFQEIPMEYQHLCLYSWIIFLKDRLPVLTATPIANTK